MFVETPRERGIESVSLGPRRIEDDPVDCNQRLTDPLLGIDDRPGR